MTDRSAVVLLSGGLDSATTLAIARAEGFEPYALTVRYGQRHHAELEAAAAIARQLEAAEHRVVKVDLGDIAASALTGASPVPKERAGEEIGAGIPPTYVPARNTVFLSLALAWAETLGAADLFIGVNVRDYSGYPDCRPEYVAAFERMANLATKAAVTGGTRYRIHTPLIRLTKRDIILRGTELGVDFGLTSTCYDPESDGTACGRCDACRIRLEGFRAARLRDPARYRSEVRAAP